MSNELEPCPFCHGKSELDTMQDRYNNKGDVVNACAIDCVNCEAHMSICYEDVPDMSIDDVVNELTAKWNTRPALCADTLEAAAKVADEHSEDCWTMGSESLSVSQGRDKASKHIAQKIRNLKGEL